MSENDELKEEIVIDEEEAKKQFLEELRNKNMKETKKLEEVNNLKDKEAIEEDHRAKDEAKDMYNIVEDKAKQENNMENEESTEEKKDVNKKLKFSLDVGKLKVTLIDTVISGLLSVVGLYLFNIILKLFGYYVADFKAIYIIILFIILILYPTIMQNLKDGRTFGQKISKIQVQEGEE